MHMVEDLGNRLRQLRQNKNLRQEQVADLIGINKKQISAYENNTRQPSYEILVRIAILFRVSTDYLLGCQSNRTLDVSGLTAEEIAWISGLVEDLTIKNQRLGEL